MSTETETRLPTATEPPAGEALQGPEFPTGESTPRPGIDKGRGQRAEDYIDILVRARNWLARGE